MPQLNRRWSCCSFLIGLGTNLVSSQGPNLRWDQQSWGPDQQETWQGSTGYVCHEVDRCICQWQNCCSVTKSCPTLCNPKDCSTPGVLSFTISQSLLKLMSVKSVMPSNHLILCCSSFSSRPQSFPASGCFTVSQLFASGGQSVEASASASVLPMNIQLDFL